MAYSIRRELLFTVVALLPFSGSPGYFCCFRAGKTIRRFGVAPKTTEDDKAGDLIADIQDGWNDDLEDRTIYKYLKEATWLAYTEENKHKGHPQDGMHEIAASSLNRLMQDPEAFGKDMIYLENDERQAIIDLLDLGMALLREKYPNEHALHQVISERRAIFNKALGR